MALSDPQPVTIGTVQSLPRISTDRNAAEYLSADGNFRLLVAHQSFRRAGEPRTRSLVKVTRKKISTDVLTDVKSYIDSSFQVTFDRPDIGFTEAELLELVSGVTTWLTAGTNANSKAVLGRQS